MAKYPDWRNMSRNAFPMSLIEALTIVVLVLEIIVLVAGRFPHFRTLPILTFDTSYVKAVLKTQGISNPGNIQDWYEPHYLSVCKGMWQSTGARIKDEAFTVCTVMAGGYEFSLPKLLAADAGLPVDTPLLSDWSFAVINTKMPFICLAIVIACTSITTIAYFITLVRTPNLTTESPLLVARVGYLASIVALILLIISSAKITSIMDNVLKAKPGVLNAAAWSSGGLYAVTWLATGLMLVMFISSVVFAFKIRPPTNSRNKVLDRKPSEYSNVY